MINQTTPSANPFSFSQQGNTGLFGQNTTQAAGSLFGPPPSTTSYLQQPTSQQSTLFGNQQQQQPSSQVPQPITGATTPFQPGGTNNPLFTVQKPPLTGSLFGNAPTPANFTAQQTPSAQQGAQNVMDPSKMKEMKYQDLPEEHQAFIYTVESHIRTQLHLANDVAVMVANNSDEIKQSYRRTKELGTRLASVKQLLARDGFLNDQLREDIRKSLRNGEMVMRFMDRARPPNQPVYLPTEAEAARRYFETLVDSLDAKLHTCLQSLEELEQVVQSNISGSTMSIQDMVDTIKSQHDVFMTIAAQAASAHETIERHWEEYRQFKKTYLGSDISTRRIPSQRSTNIDNTSLAASMLRPSAPTIAGPVHTGQAVQQAVPPLQAGIAQPQMQSFFGTGVAPSTTTNKKSTRRR